MNTYYYNKVKHAGCWMLVLLALAFTACSESSGDDSAEEFADWQNRNETYFNNIYAQAKTAIGQGSAEWKILTKFSVLESAAATTDHVVVQVLKEGTGSGCPLYTSSAYVHYIGRLIPTTQHPKGYLFDKSCSTEVMNTLTDMPAKFTVSALTDGFGTALQHMHIGDYWRIYVPYQLGYGSVTSGSIPAFSTLVFDLYLCAYADSNESMNWNAKAVTFFNE